MEPNPQHTPMNIGSNALQYIFISRIQVDNKRGSIIYYEDWYKCESNNCRDCYEGRANYRYAFRITFGKGITYGIKNIVIEDDIDKKTGMEVFIKGPKHVK